LRDGHSRFGWRKNEALIKCGVEDSDYIQQSALRKSTIHLEDDRFFNGLDDLLWLIDQLKNVQICRGDSF